MADGEAEHRTVGSYRLVAPIGAGGLGTVHLGRAQDGRYAAVEVCPPRADGPVPEPALRGHLERLRHVAGAFTHHLLASDTEAPEPWLACTWLPGRTLRDVLGRHGPWPVASALVLGVALAEGLAAIHRAGLVHGDLHPGNVLLTASGPRTPAFGMPGPAEAAGTTAPPGYLPPEILTGASPPGTAGDVFALGATVLHAVTGRAPFGDGPAHEVHHRAVLGEPDVVGLSPELPVVTACLATRPADRPGVPELVAEFRRCARGTEPYGADWMPAAVARDVASAAPPGAGSGAVTTGTGRRPSRRALLTGAGVLMVGGGLGAVLVGRGGGTRDVEDERAGRGSERPSGKAADRLTERSGTARWVVHHASEPGRRPSSDGRTVAVHHEDGKVYVMDAADGTLRWSRPTVIGPIPVRVSGDFVYASGGGDNLEARDASTGAIRWTFAQEGGQAQLDDTLYLIANRYDFRGDEHGIVFALDAQTGDTRWGWEPGSSLLSPPSLDDGVVYALGTFGTLYGWDAASGKLVSQASIPDDVYPSDQSPLVVDGAAFIVDSTGVLHAVEARYGTRRWTYRTEAHSLARPVASGGTVYVGAAGSLHAVSADTGRQLWVYPHSGQAPAVADGTLYVAHDGELHALDATDGQELWTYQGDADVSSPATDTEHVYVTDADGRLHCVYR
ncbi:PQQ-binding-like beta-propeller repeat protein [Streptomyces sp. JJ38]|uniref:serine/threonine-protein kinase n=1 Tax=Streptomyces sp. JJ38 TaxID=2738128 RepID=UPI001C59FF25|nr:serine/threonine-protein kinase [Streptomyces sp. JJ38]MBW1596709.1 serine/threonine-protein kinase [Streptomyces sp. JJ38]